jgi:hypothetical protein
MYKKKENNTNRSRISSSCPKKGREILPTSPRTRKASDIYSRDVGCFQDLILMKRSIKHTPPILTKNQRSIDKKFPKEK